MFEAFVNDRNKRTRTSARRGSCVISNDLIWYNRSNVTDDLNRSIIFTRLLSFTSSSFSYLPSIPSILTFFFYSYVLSIFRLTVRSKFFYPLLSIILVTRVPHVRKSHTSSSESSTAQHRIFATTVLQFLLHASSKPSLG